ncbi:hypothetical protein [Niallia sp. FSL M8-0099]|uniref:hypothetical protein n=1 Tax=Niallia sp. FSL M8-0099 TaxID=2954519 RepID=UPI0030F5A0DC
MIKFKQYNNGFAIEGHSHREACGIVTFMSYSCAKLIKKLDPSVVYYTSSYDNNDLGVTYFNFNPQIETARLIFNDSIDSLMGWCNKHYPGEISFIKLDTYLTINVE